MILDKIPGSDEACTQRWMRERIYFPGKLLFQGVYLCIFLFSLQCMALTGRVWLLLFNEKKKGIWEKVGSFQSNNKIKNLPHPDSERKFY